MKKKIRIGALVSGGGTNLQAIIDACEAGKIDGDLVFVGSDIPDIYGLERARQHGIPTFTTDYGAIISAFKDDPTRLSLPADFAPEAVRAKQTLFPPDADVQIVSTFLQTRAIAEAELLKKMAPHPFDLLVLAGFMRTLTPYFIDRVNTVPGQHRIMNIHPALLPAFPGVDGYGDTFRHGCKVGGCTVHFIDYGEDSGPIIGQRAFAIEPGDTLEVVKKKGLKQEWALYPECIQLFAQDRLRVVRPADVPEDGKKTKRAIVEIR